MDMVVRCSATCCAELAHPHIFAPTTTTLEKLLQVESSRCVIETCFEQAKRVVGLDYYQVHTWAGQHPHGTLVWSVYAYLAWTWASTPTHISC